MSQCKDCKHFNTNDNDQAHMGWCDVELPPWFYTAVKLNQYDLGRCVSADDACSLFKESK